MNLSHDHIKHVKRNSCLCHFNDEDINDTIHVIVDYRVSICPFNVNKCDVPDTLLPHGAAEVRLKSSHCWFSHAEVKLK